MVRVHMKDSQPSVEGFFTGFWAGHYVIAASKVIVNERVTETLDGPDLVIPKGNVMFMQRLS